MPKDPDVDRQLERHFYVVSRYRQLWEDLLETGKAEKIVIHSVSSIRTHEQALLTRIVT